MDTFLILLALAFSIVSMAFTIRYVQAGHDLCRAGHDFFEATKLKLDKWERDQLEQRVRELE